MRQLKISSRITDRNDTTNRYFNEVSKYPLLSPEEEVRLINEAKEGNKKSLDRVVLSNTRFVISVAKQYHVPSSKIEMNDIINAGNMGLIKSVTLFDTTRGFKFISFAVWWIRQSIQQFLYENDRSVRLPFNKIGVQNRLYKIACELEQTKDGIVGVSDIIDAYEQQHGILSKTDLRFVGEYIETYGHRETSIDHKIHDESDQEYSYFLEGDNNVEDVFTVEDIRQMLNKIMKSLNPREKVVIEMFYGLGRNYKASYEEISIKLNLTRERVRQIHMKALRRLKSPSNRRLLEKTLM